jgi:hypothetical protein
VTQSAVPWTIDADDPRAPPLEVWQRMSEEERERVIASLPSEFEATEASPPEGDAHFKAKVGARKALGRFFERVGRRIYLACELPVYYPGERMFAPDLFGVLDAGDHDRLSWVVAKENKGLDIALEISVSGRKAKDLQTNVERYARLGIREYFVFDRKSLRLSGYFLPELNAGKYERILPQHGRYLSSVLGLELGLDGERLRFYYGDAELPEADELIVKLESMLNQLESRLAEETRLREEETRLREEETRLREEAEQRLAVALRELAALKDK